MGLRHPVPDDRRRNLVQCPLAEGRIELLVQVRTVRSAGRDLEVLVGQPLLFDVVPKGDLAQTPVVPRARENLLLLAVGGSQGLTTERVRAGRALVAVRVAVDPGIPGSARSASFRRCSGRAFTLYCLTLRKEILFPLGWFGSSATQMTRRSPYRQPERSGVA